MKTVRTRYLLLSALILMLCAQGLQAQAPLEPAQLPANTTFYFIWRGQPSAELKKSNSIAALWDDPDFAPVRSSLTRALLKNSEEKSDAEKSKEPRLTREQLEQYATLLENPFVFGYLSDPNKKHSEASAKTGPGKATPWKGIFFVYDRTGKEAILSKAVLSLRANEKEVPQISQVTIADVPALKIDRKSGLTYWVEDGKYAVSANETVVLEEILHRLHGKSASSGSITDSAAYREAKSVLGSGQLEFFMRVPEMKNLAPDPSAGGFQIGPVLEAMKLDAIHCIAGRVLLEGAKTRVQAAALGDTAPGSLFDIWDSGTPVPPGLSVVPADAISYSDTQINLDHLYAFIKRVATSIMPPSRQGSSVDMLEMMAQAKLGQSLSSAVALFTGEFVSLQTNRSLDNDKQVYLIGIRNKPDTLKLLHSVLGDRITAEHAEGDTTFLKVSSGGGQSAAGTAAWDFYHVAATPDYLVISSSVESVRDLLAKRAQSAKAGISTTSGFQAARTQFPANVNGLGYFDFRKVDWPDLKARLIAEANKPPATKRPGAPKAETTPTPSWMLDVNPEVFARHLHSASSASWKDAQGLHFDEWIE
jgi:hypothetical protein